MATMFQTVLRELSAAFTRDKRASDGATFYKLRDEGQRWCSRTWLTSEQMHDLHEAVDGANPRLPDDWIYEQAAHVASALHERNPESARDVFDDTHEIVDSLVDIYTHDLLAWLGDSHNAAIADEAMREGLIEANASIERRAAVGQYEAISRIANYLIGQCEHVAECRGKDERVVVKCCSKCSAPLATIHLPGDPHEMCAECAMATDPGSEIAYREALGLCAECGGEHCPHYACTTSGGQGHCDNCTGDDDV